MSGTIISSDKCFLAIRLEEVAANSHGGIPLGCPLNCLFTEGLLGDNPTKRRESPVEKKLLRLNAKII